MSALSTYSAKDITVLEGLEPVRRRPSMYIGGVDGKGLHHLVWEIVDNAVDEYLNDHADAITVTLHKSGDAVSVHDNGRGIPVDMHPKYKRPALELILATLRRDGFEWEQTFKRGKVASELQKLGPFRGHGTEIYFEPDPDIFKTTQFDA